MTVSGPDLPTSNERVATLRQVALVGGLNEETRVSCAELGDQLDHSTRRIRTHLRKLASDDYLDQASDTDGMRVRVTDRGRELLVREYERYQRLFDDGTELVLDGAVEDGLGEGQHYISLPGYVEQFETRLGYSPFPGTLNVRLDDRSADLRNHLPDTNSVAIDEWTDEERSYGGATCHPVVVEANGRVESPAHVLVPERTHHDSDLLEVIAPTELRSSLDLSPGSSVRLRVVERTSRSQ